MSPSARRAGRTALKIFLSTLCIGFVLALIAVASVIYYYGRDLPDRVDIASAYRPPVVSTVYDIRGRPIGEFYHQRRVVIPLERVPSHVIHAFLAAEDARFFKHRGVDVVAIARAFFSNLRSRGVRQGGSTITQQLVRGLLLSPERTFRRKVREAILAFKVERNHSKEEILYLYLNQIYLGHGNYGVAAASRDYFGKDVENLTVPEAALLAGLPRSPTRSSPYRDFFAATERQRYVLRRMFREGFIDRSTYQEALESPVRLTPSQDLNSQTAPYFVEYIRRSIGDQFGFDPLLQGGLQIYTSLDASLQMAAQNAVREGLNELRLRLKSKNEGSNEKEEVQAALIALDPHTGLVRALVGGYDFSFSQFNRALQARRQPGSAFKPIIYSAALESGFSELSIVQDGPLSFRMGSGKYWRPQNYQNRFFGPVTLRTALAHSLNSVAVRLVGRLGVERVIRQARKLGIESRLEKNLSISLGSSSVSLLELVNAYGVFAAGGNRAAPVFIVKVTDRDGKILHESQPRLTRALSPEVSFVLTDMLRNVVQSGTGRGANHLGVPVAGKTGTSSEFRDAWFVGYTPSLSAGVWVGYDDLRPLGDKETGGRAALPIWLAFMKEATKDPGGEDFPVPEGIEWLQVDFTKDGYPLPLFEQSLQNSIPYIATAKDKPVSGPGLDNHEPNMKVSLEDAS
jgi:penicillin-binding protein 1A